LRTLLKKSPFHSRAARFSANAFCLSAIAIAIALTISAARFSNHLADEAARVATLPGSGEAGKQESGIVDILLVVHKAVASYL
jgi:hypothetical protein